MSYLGNEIAEVPQIKEDGKIEKPKDQEKEEVTEEDKQRYISFLNQERE